MKCCTATQTTRTGPIVIGPLGTVIDIVAEERSALRIGQQVRTALMPEPIECLKQQYAIAKDCTGNNYLPLLWLHYKDNRAVLLQAIDALNLMSAIEDESLIHKLEHVT